MSELSSGPGSSRPPVSVPATPVGDQVAAATVDGESRADSRRRRGEELRARIEAQVVVRRGQLSVAADGSGRGSGPSAALDRSGDVAVDRSTDLEPGGGRHRLPQQAEPASDRDAGNAPSSRGPRARRSRRGSSRSARAFRAGLTVVLVAAAAVLLRTFVLASYYIPSGSMEPTLHGCSGCNNDHVLVDKLSYRMHSVHRGDVVVFSRPPAAATNDKVLIKRVIGLPGDVLTDVGGTIYVDGRPLQEPYINPVCHGTQSFPTSITVPAGDVWVMGDNRCDSMDSRVFGAIRQSSIIGRAVMIVWPLGRLHYL